MTCAPFHRHGRGMSRGALLIALIACGSLDACKSDSGGHAGAGGRGGTVASTGAGAQGGTTGAGAAAGGGTGGGAGDSGSTGGAAGATGGQTGRGGSTGGAAGTTGGQSGRGGSTGGAAGTGGGQAGSGGTGGARDAGADHTTDGGRGAPCWQWSDCVIITSFGNVGFCQAPDDRTTACGAVIPNSCDADSQCANLVCQQGRPCASGAMCSVLCTTAAPCPYHWTCKSDGHCQPPSCAAGGACLPDDICFTDGSCRPRGCTADSECSVACVNGRCYDRPGTCESVGI